MSIAEMLPPTAALATLLSGLYICMVVL